MTKVIFDSSSYLKNRKRKRQILALLVLLPLLFGFSLFSNLPLVFGHFPMLIHLTRPQPSKRVYLLGEPVTISLNIQNVSPVGFSTPVCVREIVARKSYHIGCVPEVTFAPLDGGSRFTFEVSRPAQRPGRHLVIFSYRDIYGNWHEIMDSGHHLLRTSYRVN
ncbi:MAG: hypothetical protein ACOZBZ_00205 [Patescibacteria group bacterium]